MRDCVILIKNLQRRQKLVRKLHHLPDSVHLVLDPYHPGIRSCPLFFTTVAELTLVLIDIQQVKCRSQSRQAKVVWMPPKSSRLGA